MQKKQTFSIIFLLLIFSFLLGIPKVIAAPENQNRQEAATETPALSQTPDSGLKQLAVFGSPPIPQTFQSGDKSKQFLSIDNNLEIYNADTNELIERFALNDEYDNSILAVDYNGERVALSSENGFYIFNTVTKTKNGIYESEGISYPYFFAFSPTEETILYGIGTSTSGGGYLDLKYNGLTRENKPVGLSLRNPADAQLYHGYYSPIISPDGNYIAAGYSDFTCNKILVWTTKSSSIFYEIPDIPGKIQTLAISPNSKILASGGGDGIVRLWNLQTGEFIRSINSFNDGISNLKFNDTGDLLYITTEKDRQYIAQLSLNRVIEKDFSSMNSLLAQKVENGNILQSEGTILSFTYNASLKFSPDGSKIALAEGSVQIWDVATQQLVAGFLPEQRFEQRNIAFDENGERLAILSNRGNIYVWNFENDQIELQISRKDMLEHQLPFTTENVSNAVDHDLTDFFNSNIVFSPDGEQVAFANGLSVEIWDIAKGTQIQTLTAKSQYGRPQKITYSKDGKSIIACTNADKYFLTWDINNGHIINTFEINNVGYNHGRNTGVNHGYFFNFTTYNMENWIESWNMETNEIVKLPISNQMPISPVYNPTNTLFATIDNGSILYLYQTDTGQLIYQEKGFSSSAILAINADETILATANNGEITFWDIAPVIEQAKKDNYVSPTLIPPFNKEDYIYYAEPTPVPNGIDASSNENLSANETSYVQLNKQLNSGKVISVNWEKDKIWFTSSNGLISYDTLNETPTTVFTHKYLLVSNIQGAADESYYTAGTSSSKEMVLVDQTTSRILLTTKGYGEPVISPDKLWLAYYSGDYRLMLWNIKEERSEYILPTYTPTAPLAFSPNSQLMAVAQNNGMVQVWNVKTGTIQYAFNGNKVPCTHIHFSRDGKTLIGIAGGSVWVCPLTSENKSIEFEIYAGDERTHETYFDQVVTAADINRTNEIIAIADEDAAIHFFTLDNQKEYENPVLSDAEITHLAFSSQGNRLLSADVNGKVTIWDADSSVALNEFSIFTGDYLGLVSLNDGNIAAWTKSQITIYDPETLEIYQQVNIEEKEIFDVSTNGRWAAAYSPHAVSIYDIETGNLLTTLQPQAEEIILNRFDDFRAEQLFYGAAFSTNNQSLVSYGTGGTWVYELNQSEIEKSTLLGNIDAVQIRIAGIDPDGSHIILSTGEGYSRPSVYDTKQQNELYELSYPDSYGLSRSGREYESYTFSPDGKSVYSLRYEFHSSSRLEIHDPSSGKLIAYLNFEDKNGASFAISQDGTIIAIGFDNGRVQLYNAKTLALIQEFHAHAAEVTNLAFSNNGEYLISTGEEGSIISWHIGNQ